MFKRTKRNFKIDDSTSFKQKLFAWAKQFETAIWLDSNNYEQAYSCFDACLAVEEFTAIKTDYQNAFEKLKEYQSYTKDYIFGYISYDVKNDVENLSSTNFDGLHFPDLYFFQPQKLIFIKGNTIEFEYLQMIDDEIEEDFEDIISNINNSTTLSDALKKEAEKTSEEIKEDNIKIKLRIHKEEYHQKVTKVLEHIHRGDIYEANFCQEFYAENTRINPYKIYSHLNDISTPPFATFFRHENLYVLSATPERYLKKEGDKIISQPIKGTAKRLIDPIEDQKIAFDLARDEKERAENIMIVDLVRNDLSKTAKKGSVQVAELCKIHSFKQVHQMISTIVSEITPNTHPVDVIKDTFPMGSMTGAPKVSAMKIMENLEQTKRGLYSGTVGYFTPNGDFDFNVIIRSILYNSDSKYVSFSVGGAITAKSIPEKEYEECLLKAKAMKYVLLHSK
ncbi:anthranilate synthase component I family protein [Tenacibaculum finnmarkense]|uniref:anthranilate synthase component I family protein n=1 Tax=Tenacibaculum finnmarkense TaxID=2781243 RepID=UPI001E570310|nr:anthranilate synthase component I family protein [Tenacibaculum finnmarkense]MCD8412695.1 anthranilate synthase component I family protein [Tenacibaculum finnmarkense genomovar ulcerans]MCG8207506.1 anthranilate synthase component I family protein [Tenacibaculum finnmarkense genomovar finnmarkense]MCG8723617.1 anthranilate synthase component I family protein [Tenacibaculum finnmarkense]MCG8741934.1 anthranilate synthase component I family protein [Tenacibaculum finnmarkense]MCG8765313.1 ant